MFFYTRKEPSALQIEGKEPKFKTYKDCLNIEKVIRGVELEDERLLLLMDDIHQRPQDVEVKNKQGKTTSIKRIMATFQSEVFLEREDAIRFYQITHLDI